MASGLKWTLIDTWGSQLLGLVVFVLLARLLTPVDFGLVALAAVFVALCQLFVDQGLGDAIIQRPTVSRLQLDTAFWVAVLTGSLLTIAGILLAIPIAKLLGDQRLEPILQVLSLVFVPAALSSIQLGLLRREMAFRSLAVRKLSAVALSGVVGIGWRIWALRRHPQIFMPFHREPLYFGDDLTRRYGRMSLDDYLRLFRDAKPGQRVGEASTWYLYSRSAFVNINITSVSGQAGQMGQANYSSTKAGLIGLTKATARELASRGITCNAVAPGFVETELTIGLPDELKRQIIERTPLGRFATTDEVAYAVAFLASDEAAYITEQVLAVDGGLVMM